MSDPQRTNDATSDATGTDRNSTSSRTVSIVTNAVKSAGRGFWDGLKAAGEALALESSALSGASNATAESDVTSQNTNQRGRARRSTAGHGVMSVY